MGAEVRPIHLREIPAGVVAAVDALCEMARDGGTGSLTVELDEGRSTGVHRQLRLRFPGDTNAAIERVRDLVARGFMGRVSVEVGRGRGTVVVVEDGGLR